MTTDHLGSPRVLTNKQGEVVSRRDFMPFGEEIVAMAETHRTPSDKYGVGDGVRQKFTGYERDEETGLDFAEARYYYNNHGRFTAVDPLLASGKSSDPQTFNRYVYVMNSPLRLIDPSGLIAGDFYDDKLNKIGSDGVNDNKQYVVVDEKEKKLIKSNNEAGKTTALSSVASAVTLPSYAVRQAIGRAVDRSDKDGRHESGLQWGKDSNGAEKIVDAKEGAPISAGQTSVSIDTSIAANPAEQGTIKNVGPSVQVVQGSYDNTFTVPGIPKDVEVPVGANRPDPFVGSMIPKRPATRIEKLIAEFD